MSEDISRDAHHQDLSFIEIARQAVWDDLLKCIVIVPHTGAYAVVKELGDSTGAEAALSSAQDVYHYWQLMIEHQLVHPDDVPRFSARLREIRSLDVKERFSGQRVEHVIRYRVNGEFRWVSIDVIYPVGYPDVVNSCVITMTPCENEIISMAGSLTDEFQKILKVNIIDGSYSVIKIAESERASLPSDGTISGWFRAFMTANGVHPHDVDVFKHFTDLTRIRKGFEVSRDPIRCRYRRKIDGEWRWVLMELLPTIDFAPETPTAMLYVKDIDNARINAPSEDSDSLTGMKDAKAFESLVSTLVAHHGFSKSEGMGVIKASLPMLRYLINARGKTAGDIAISKYSQRFSRIFERHPCFRTGDNEFSAVVVGESMSAFNKIATDFVTMMHRDTPPIAVVGFAWENSVSVSRKVVDDAKAKLVADLAEFQDLYPMLAVGQVL